MNKLLLSCISLCIASSVAAQSAVVSAKDKESAKDEPVASYYLPKTVIEIEVETTHKVFKAEYTPPIQKNISARMPT